ncbi:serine/threonine-protein kinase [Arthrobacter sp. zg-Y769]|uniref:serine/threonine-protein kinase n=1 Tax=Arthrobacter sp. zg-Y769 TaxID=2894191 RepID=UPI001E4EFBA5|nr:serine/threonine-protein kinase [Arthrobacter sp. zg-Y769]MCC9205487.1 serine/threonine protein kinase [Arthrobacter sp. zg-Y769]
MTKRAPAPPPEIAGYRYLRHLGSGGFADVYLYEQDHPRRRVAVKVLLSDLRTDSARRSFEAEANLMAQLSSHPYIVTIYEADITDDGHSYLAMEYCSRPSLDIRYRQGGLPLAEVLTVGIQVASAVETAHRAGIAHRDIKPANILTTDYNRPALTDFGISGTTDAAEDEDLGLSIPWSPPEALTGGRADGIRIDVWALGATLYTLLAARSPFVLPGQGNTQRELIDRIVSQPLRPTGRADVPESLELVLATAMAKAPESRFSSAYAFGLALQRIQGELNLANTPFEVLQEADSTEDRGEDEDRTRIRRVVSIDPHTAAAPPRRAPLQRPTPSDPGRSASARAAAPGVPPDTAAGKAAAGGETHEGTVMRSGLAAAEPGAGTAAGPEAFSWPEPPRRRGRTALRIGAVAAAAAAVGIVAAALLLPEAEPKSVLPTPSRSAQDALAGSEGVVLPPESLAATASEGSVVFTWDNPEPADGDIYLWRTVSATAKGELVRSAEAKAQVPASGSEACIEVQVARVNGKASAPVAFCAPQ